MRKKNKKNLLYKSDGQLEHEIRELREKIFDLEFMDLNPPEKWSVVERRKLTRKLNQLVLEQLDWKSIYRYESQLPRRISLE